MEMVLIFIVTGLIAEVFLNETSQTFVVFDVFLQLCNGQNINKVKLPLCFLVSNS